MSELSQLISEFYRIKAEIGQDFDDENLLLLMSNYYIKYPNDYPNINVNKFSTVRDELNERILSNDFQNAIESMNDSNFVKILTLLSIIDTNTKLNTNVRNRSLPSLNTSTTNTDSQSTSEKSLEESAAYIRESYERYRNTPQHIEVTEREAIYNPDDYEEAGGGQGLRLKYGAKPRYVDVKRYIDRYDPRHPDYEGN